MNKGSKSRIRWTSAIILGNASGILGYALTVNWFARKTPHVDTSVGFVGAGALLPFVAGVYLVGPVLSGAVNWAVHSAIVERARASVIVWGAFGAPVACFVLFTAALLLLLATAKTETYTADEGQQRMMDLALAMSYSIGMSGLFAVGRALKQALVNAA